MVTDKERIKLQNIKNIVLDRLEFTQEMVEDKSQKREIVLVRQMCFYMMCHYKSFFVTFQDIGNFIGGKDYATVHHSVKAIRDQYDSDKNIKSLVDELHDRIESAELLRGDGIKEYGELHRETREKIINENKRHKEIMDAEIDRHKKAINKLLGKMV